MGYTAPERETTMVCDDESKQWLVYTAQPVIMTKLRRAGAEPYWTETEPDKYGEPRIIAAKYKLDWPQISIRRKRQKKEREKV